MENAFQRMKVSIASSKVACCWNCVKCDISSGHSRDSFINTEIREPYLIEKKRELAGVMDTLAYF